MSLVLPNPPRRVLLGKITREAPPGPEMTREQFELAMEDMTHDAARWRWVQTHWNQIINLEVEALPFSGGSLRTYVDRERGR